MCVCVCACIKGYTHTQRERECMNKGRINPNYKAIHKNIPIMNTNFTYLKKGVIKMQYVHILQQENHLM